MLIFSLIASGILLAIALWVARLTGRYKEANIAVAVIGALGCALTASPLVIATAVGIIAMGFLCKARSLPYRDYVISTFAVTFFCSLTTCLVAAWKVKERADIAARFPFESISDRLAYEKENKANSLLLHQRPVLTERTSKSDGNRGIELASYITSMEARIDDIEYSWQARSRVMSLRAIHDDYVTQFINAPGFGVVRGARPSLAEIPLEEPSPVPLPSSEYDYSNKPTSETVNNEVARESLEEKGPTSGKLQNLHIDGLFDFLNPRGFGYIKTRDQVAGF